MNQNGPMPVLIGGALVVAILATLTVPGGWVLWLPVVLALAVVARCWSGSSR